MIFVRHSLSGPEQKPRGLVLLAALLVSVPALFFTGGCGSGAGTASSTTASTGGTSPTVSTSTSSTASTGGTGSSSTTAGGLTSTTTAASSSTSSSQSAGGQAGGGDWPMYHHDAARSGVASDQAVLGKVRQAWTSTGLDGPLYAQPLVVGDRVLSGQRR